MAHKIECSCSTCTRNDRILELAGIVTTSMREWIDEQFVEIVAPLTDLHTLTMQIVSIYE